MQKWEENEPESLKGCESNEYNEKLNGGPTCCFRWIGSILGHTSS